MKASIFCALAAAGLAAAASGADDARQQERVRVIADRYAACVIERSASKARRFVVERGQPPISGDCLVRANDDMGGKMRFPGDNYRYALAGALLARDYPSGVPAEVAQAPELPHDPPEVLDETTLPKDAKRAEAVRNAFMLRRATWVMDTIGDCATRQNPTAAYALVRSEVGSPAERAAFATLNPAIGGCLPDQATVRFAPGTLRGAVALNLYRLAHSVRTPGA